MGDLSVIASRLKYTTIEWEIRIHELTFVLRILHLILKMCLIIANSCQDFRSFSKRPGKSGKEINYKDD